MNELLEKIPGLKQAIERERFIRDQSFLDLPEKLCGIEVQPLTLRRWILLNSCGSPFVCGGIVEPYDVASMFIVLTGKNRGFRKFLLLRKVRRLRLKESIAEIELFFDEQLQDKPASTKGEYVSYFSFAAGLVDRFGSEYGWSEAQTLDAPVKRLFQYMKAITKRHNQKAIMFNPSDKVKGRWLREQNEITATN